MDSAPERTETPNSRGASRARAFSLVTCTRHLATRRRILFPTAIGRTPPDLLDRAVSGAPHNRGAMSRGARPAARVFVRFVRAFKHSSETWGTPHEIMSSRCVWRRAIAPGEVEAGNERRAVRTAGPVIEAGDTEPLRAFQSRDRPANGAGWRSCSAAKLASEHGARGGEVRAREARPTAPLRTKRAARATGDDGTCGARGLG
jgi:hypothetical protein